MNGEVLFEDKVMENILYPVFQGYKVFFRIRVSADLYRDEDAESAAKRIASFIFLEHTDNWYRIMTGDWLYVFYQTEKDCDFFLEILTPLIDDEYISFEIYKKP